MKCDLMHKDVTVMELDIDEADGLEHDTAMGFYIEIVF